MFDSVIIGAGVAGCVAARDLAESGRKVLVLEQRDHIGGNCYDEKDEHGILIHKYGPHIFHTKEQKAYDYLSRFTDWYAFGHEVVANVYGKLIPVPFNLNTLHMVYEQEKADALEKKLIDAFGLESRVPILKLREHEDPEIREIADYVYENIFLHSGLFNDKTIAEIALYFHTFYYCHLSFGFWFRFREHDTTIDDTYCCTEQSLVRIS